MRRLVSWIFRLSAYRIALFVGVLAMVAHVGFALHTGRADRIPVLGRLESIFYDLKFLERGARPPPKDVVIAAVDEKAIDTLGRFPWPREDMAALVDKLEVLGARTIVFDVAFTDQAFEGKDARARALKERFDAVSLAGKGPAALLDRLSMAKVDAAGAASAAEDLKGRSGAVEDVRARLSALPKTLSAVLLSLTALKDEQAQFALSLAQAGLGQSPDQALADAIHHAGNVVLGSFLLRPSDLAGLSVNPAAALQEVSYMRLPMPTRGTDALSPDDGLDGTTEKATSAPAYLPTYAAVMAPLARLVAPGADGRPAPVGFFNVEPDSDGVVRREPLVLLVGDARDWRERTILPGLDYAAVLAAERVSPDYTRIWSASRDGREIETVAYVKNSLGWRDRTPKVKDFTRIPVDSGGRLLVNYYGPKRSMPTVSLADVWNGAVPRRAIDGKVVVIGATALGTYDQRVTPFDRFAPGVFIHATTIANLLHHDYLRRPWWALPVEALVLLAVALVVGLVLSRVSVLRGIPVTLATIAAYHLADLGLFAHGFVLFGFLPIAEVTSIYVLQTIYRYNVEEKDKRHYRRALQYYLTRSVMEEVLRDPSKLKLGGDKRVLTVMFSDIRGFTGISEKLPAEQLAKLLNEYLTPMTNLVFANEGTLDKYIGDALMAIYGAPVDQPDHALRCCRTAMAMVRELDRLQERWRMEGRGWPRLDIGIGINSGPMVVGNMGADQRFEYTVVGDNVNLASRLEGTNKDFRSHVIVSESTRSMCAGKVAVRELGAVRVKGRQEPVKVFELLDDRPPSGEIADVIDRFDRGVHAFRERRWQTAREAFQSVLELWPLDGPAQAYLEFCDASEKDPPGEDWDGVYTMTHK